MTDAEFRVYVGVVLIALSLVCFTVGLVNYATRRGSAYWAVVAMFAGALFGMVNAWRLIA